VQAHPELLTSRAREEGAPVVRDGRIRHPDPGWCIRIERTPLPSTAFVRLLAGAARWSTC